MDISNKTLAYFLVFAVVITLFGLAATMQKLGELSKVGGVTGYATSGTGTASVNITVATDISVPNATIDFGDGVVNTTLGYCNNATMHTNGTGENLGNCWVNSTLAGGSVNTVVPDKFVIVNDGSINVSVTMTSVNQTAADFIGGGTGYPEPEYQYTSAENETGACMQSNANATQWWNISAATMNICSMLEFADDKDSVYVALRIVVPADASGEKEDTLTFTSAQA